MEKILDLFCGAGGASVGLHKAGFEVVGLDINPQPNYPFEFIQADALEIGLDGYDAYWASPPCQAYSSGGTIESRKRHPRLIEPIRMRMVSTHKPYIIENVVGAPLHNPIMLCGVMFGLKVIRHRLFESSFTIQQPPHPKHIGSVSNGDYFGVYSGGRCGCFGNNEKRRKLKIGTLEEWQHAMGIDWMTKKELTQAVPPAYSEYIGKWLLQKRKGIEDYL